LEEVVVEFDNVYFSYTSDAEVLKNINLKIKKGESIGIVGKNGAGKSTLLMLITGIIFPQKGTIKVCGYNLNKKNLCLIRKKLGFSFQDPDDQLFMPTVYDDVSFGLRNYGFAEDEIEKQTIETLKKIGILHLIDRAPYKLSGGEKRLVALATILSLEPDILLLDEPTSNLDPKSRRSMINLLKSLKQTKLIATHDLDMVMDLCERTIIIKDGTIISDKPTEKILTNRELLEESDLELPLSLQRCESCDLKVKTRTPNLLRRNHDENSSYRWPRRRNRKSYNREIERKLWG